MTGEQIASPDEIPADVVSVELPKELESPSGIMGAIYSGIDAQRSVAVSYVRKIRRGKPTATPTELVRSLENHYLLSVTASGTAVGATAFIPGAGTAIALGAGAAEILLQFELAALFGLAVAEVHGLNIQDRDRARAVILSLMLGPDGRNKVADLARAAIRRDPAAMSGIAARSRQYSGAKSVDDLPLAELLGTGVSAEFVPSILSSVQDLAKKKLPEKAAIAGTRLVPGGVGLILGGFGGYTAGNDVIQASRQAFGSLPEQLPEWLEPVEDEHSDPSPEPFEFGMRGAVGKIVDGSGSVISASAAGVTTAVSAIGAGASSAVSAVSRNFRSVDIDGDGIPDEARALTAAKDVGRAATGTAASVRGAASSLLKFKKGEKPTDDHGLVEPRP